MPMESVYRTPKLAILQNPSAPYRGEWVIYHYANREYTAVHEVQQLEGVKKTVESISLKSLADAQSFFGYLSSRGWIKTWTL